MNMTSKTNILLLSSPVTEASAFFTFEKTPPLGLGYLMQILRRDGHKVIFKDLYLNPSIIDEIESILIRENIDIVGVSINTICYSGAMMILHIVNQLRAEKKWNGRIVVGGPHASVFPETIPDYVDHIFIGEAEEVVGEMASGKTLPRIISGKKVQNLDDLPMAPYEEFITLPYSFSNQWMKQGRIVTLNTSRGCPFSCQFCSVGSVWGNSYRFQSAERVVEEVIRLKTDFGVAGIYFREDNFTLNRNRVTKFCKGLLNKGVRLPWVCETRVDTLTADTIDLMARAGCRGFYIGAESGSQRVLDYMKKGILVEQVENVVTRAKKAGIRCYLSFVLGVPTETDNERFDTIALIDRLKPYSYGLSVFTGIPFSNFYWEMLKEHDYGLITSSGIIYQKNHNQLIDRFIGNNDCRIPENINDETAKMQLILFDKMAQTRSASAMKDSIVISASSQNIMNQLDHIDKRRQAVINYFFGRARLRARQFHLARTFFLKAFQKDHKLKYLIFLVISFLPSSQYSFYSDMVNRVKRR